MDLKIEDMAFDSIIPAVQSGKADIGAAGMTVTEDRATQVDFSDSYYTGVQVIIVTDDSDIAEPDDLKGKKIGVQQGTTGDIYSTDDFGDDNVERFNKGMEAVQALQQGKIDAVIIDNQPAKTFVEENEGLKILETSYVEEDYALAIKKGNDDLVKKVNDAIKELKEDGTFDKIVAKYITDKSGTDWWCLMSDFKARFIMNFIKDDRWHYIADGLKVTLIVTFCAVLIGVVLGFLLAIVRSTYDKTGKLKLLNLICQIYITVIRGTPVVVQLLIIYFVIFASVDVSKTIVAILAFGMNSSAYVAEIFRSGIMAVDNGQFEAGRSLGFNYRQTMIYIIMPQAFKNVLPALGNEFIVLLKETSVAGYIALQDLTKGGDIIRSRTYDALMPLMAVAIIYLVMVMIFSKLVSMLERRLRNSDH